MRNAPVNVELDEMDRRLINFLQTGFPVCDQPFLEVAKEMGLEEGEVISRVDRLLELKVLSRFGPMFNAERLGGGITLAAMQVPEDAFEQVAGVVNGFSEIAHNYERDHEFNMWFVIATERPEDIDVVLKGIESGTGYPVYAMPKIEEFYVGLHFNV